MIVPTESSSSESSEFLAMIQRVIFSASFIGCLEFIPESSLPLARFDVCHPKQPLYLLFLSLEVMPRVPIALHLLVTHDDITISSYKIAKKTTNFLYIHIVSCRNCS